MPGFGMTELVFTGRHDPSLPNLPFDCMFMISSIRSIYKLTRTSFMNLHVRRLSAVTLVTLAWDISILSIDMVSLDRDS
jgi:hypothetical protein